MNQIRRIHVSLPSRGHEPPIAPLQLADPHHAVPDLSPFKVMLCRCIAKIHVLPKAMVTN